MLAAKLRIIKVVLIVFVNLLAFFPTVTVVSQAYVSIPLGGGTGSGDIRILPGGEKAYVAATYEDTVVVIDTDPLSPSFNTVIATIPVGINPGGIAITPDGTRVYVTNQGNTISDVDSISVISTASDTVIVTSPLGSNTAPGGIAVTPDGTRAYFTTFEKKLRIFDTDPTSLSYNLPIDSIDIPLLLYGKIAITPDGTKAVVNWSGMIAHAMDVIDVEPGSPTYNTIIGSPVPVVSGQSGDVAVSPDSAFAYATGSTSLCKVCKIDLQTFDIAVNSEDLSAHQWYVALTPDGANLYTATPNSTELSIFNTADLTLLATLELGGPLGSIAITPDGSRAYVVRDPISSNSEVVVVPLPPVIAGFSASPESGTAPLNVNFSDQSFGATSWFWDFGDGADSIEQNPSHTYISAGTYTVGLAVTGPGGSDSETKMDLISVSQPPPPPPCQPSQGTIGTEIIITGQDFGENQGKVLIGESKCKVLEWTDTSIKCLMKKVRSTMGPGTYGVTIKRKGKGIEPIVLEDAFSIMAPSIDIINPDSDFPMAEVTITGSFFGTKKVKVYMDDGVRTKPKRCKVIFLTMDPSTGASTLVILVPKKGLLPGVCDVTVTNKVGEDTRVGGFTIQ